MILHGKTHASERVLVTGGAGFLGSHLCERLLSDGYEVYCVDNLLTGSTENIDHLRADAQFHFIKQDVIDPLNFDVDLIFNLACPASPIHYQSDPIHTTKTSVLGALNVLELAVRCNAKILQASTSEVYGDPLQHPQNEKYWGHVNPVGERSCYDEGKRCAESLFFDYHRRHGVKIKVVRIFNTYGPRMHPADGRVVSNFIMQALEGKSITVYGDGTQTRSFCYVDDMIEGFIRMMNTGDDVIGPVNLGNPNELNVSALADMVVAMSGSPSKIKHFPLPSDDPQKRKPDIGKAKSLLDWKPETPLEAGLEKTIFYFNNYIASAREASGEVIVAQEEE